MFLVRVLSTTPLLALTQSVCIGGNTSAPNFPMSHAINHQDSTTLEALAIRAQQGDAKSFDELVRRMEPRVRGFLLPKLGSSADTDDLVQETFVKAHQNIARYDSTYRFSTWLFTIANNLARSHFRQKRAQGSHTNLTSNHSNLGEAASLAERDEGARLWRRASELLKPRQYLTLWLRYGEDLNVEEIAQKIGKSRVSVRVSLYRSRKRLAAERSQEQKRERAKQEEVS